MAIIYRSQNTGQGVGTVTVTKPTGGVVGYLMVAVITIHFDIDVDSGYHYPAGWKIAAAARGDGPGLYIWYKFFDSSDVSSTSYTWSNPVDNYYMQGGILLYSGVHPDDPITSISVVRDVTDADKISPRIYVEYPDSLLVRAMASDSIATANAPTFNFPSGHTGRFTKAKAGSTNSASLTTKVCEIAAPTIGLYADATYNWVQYNTDDGSGTSIAIRADDRTSTRQTKVFPVVKTSPPAEGGGDPTGLPVGDETVSRTSATWPPSDGTLIRSADPTIDTIITSVATGPMYTIKQLLNQFDTSSLPSEGEINRASARFDMRDDSTSPDFPLKIQWWDRKNDATDWDIGFTGNALSGALITDPINNYSFVRQVDLSNVNTKVNRSGVTGLRWGHDTPLAAPLFLDEVAFAGLKATDLALGWEGNAPSLVIEYDPTALQTNYNLVGAVGGGPLGPAPPPGGFPQIAATNSGNQATDVTSHTINLPTGITAGDLLFTFVAFSNTFSTSNFATENPGWVQLAAGTPGVPKPIIYYKIADGTEGSNLTINVTNGMKSAHVTYRINSWHGTTPPEISIMASGTDNSVDPAGIATSWLGYVNTLWIAVGAYDNGTATVIAHPTGYSFSPVSARTNTTAGVGISVASLESAVAAVDPDSFVLSLSEAWKAYTIAVRPA